MVGDRPEREREKFARALGVNLIFLYRFFIVLFFSEFGKTGKAQSTLLFFLLHTLMLGCLGMRDLEWTYFSMYSQEKKDFLSFSRSLLFNSSRRANFLISLRHVLLRYAMPRHETNSLVFSLLLLPSLRLLHTSTRRCVVWVSVQRFFYFFFSALARHLAFVQNLRTYASSAHGCLSGLGRNTLVFFSFWTLSEDQPFFC